MPWQTALSLSLPPPHDHLGYEQRPQKRLAQASGSCTTVLAKPASTAIMLIGICGAV